MKCGGEGPPGQVGLERLARSVAEKRVHPVDAGPGAALRPQDQRGPGGEPGRIFQRPGLDRTGGRPLPGREVGALQRQIEERRPLVPRDAVPGAPGHGERRGEIVERVLETRHGGEVPAGDGGVPAPGAPADAGPVEEGAHPGGPLGGGARAAERAERAVERFHRACGAEESGALRAGGAGAGEHGGTGPEPFRRVAAAVEDPGAVEEEAEAGQRLGGAEVRGAQEREQRGPVEFTRGGEGGADVADQRDAGKRAGRRGGERHAQACEGFRQSLQDPPRGDDGDVGRGEAPVEEGSGEAGRGVALRVVGRGGQPDHPPPGDGAGRREPDLEVALDGELVERLDPAQPGLRGDGSGRLLGEEGDAGQDPPGPRNQRRAQVEGGAGGGEEPFQDEEAEVAGLLGEGAALGGDGCGTEGAGRVEGVAIGEQVLVGGERGSGGEEPFADASGCGGGGGAEVGRGDLGGAKLGEEARGGPACAVARTGAGEEAGVAGGGEGEEALGEGRQDGAPVRRGGEEAGGEVLEGRDARTEEEAVLRVAEAALDPGFPERVGDDDEIGHWGGRIRGGADSAPRSSLRGRVVGLYRPRRGPSGRWGVGIDTHFAISRSGERGAREGASGRRISPWGDARVPGEVRDPLVESRAPGHPRALGEAEISRETVDP